MDAMVAAAGPKTKRPDPEDRLEDVVTAGAAVFAQRGFRRTQMADAAREMAVSPGNLYNYVESKDALFYLVLRRALGERPGDHPLEIPVTGASVAVTAEWMAQRLHFVNAFPNLEKACTEQMRAVDSLAVEEYGLLLIQMMENAGARLADLASRRFRPRAVEVLCGIGGNGGGGLVAALPPRQPRCAGARVARGGPRPPGRCATASAGDPRARGREGRA